MKWRAYVKEQTDLASVPKAFLDVSTAKISEDLLSTSNSSITVVEIPSNVNTGDIVLVANQQGIIVYKGIIKSIDENTISMYQMQHFYGGTWVYETYSSASTIESEAQYVINRYAQGYMKDSTYRDMLINQEKSVVALTAGSSTSGNIETKDAKTTMDMEDFIYSLYDKYEILLEFDIPYSGACSCVIKKPNYSTIKIGNNNNAIVGISPITEVEETNKLIIYDKDGVYKKTFIAKSDGTIVEEPSSLAGRFNVTKTKIVFSDDDVDDLKKSNLPEKMYNHKLTFVLNTDNKLYSYRDLKLGTPLDIWINNDYYSTVITARSFSKDEKSDVSQITYTCGKVRTSLTSALTMRYATL